MTERVRTDTLIGTLADEEAQLRFAAQLKREREENAHTLAMFKATAEADLNTRKNNTRRWLIVTAAIVVIGSLITGGVFGIPVAVDFFGQSVSSGGGD